MKKELEMMIDDVTLETTVCASCGYPRLGDICQSCGLVQDPKNGLDIRLNLKVGEHLSVDGEVFDIRSMVTAADGVYLLHGDYRGASATIQIYAQKSHADAMKKHREILGDSALQPTVTTDINGMVSELFWFGDVSSLSGVLGRAVIERTENDVFDLVERWFTPVASVLVHMQQAGYFFGGLDPADVFFTSDGQVRLRIERPLLDLSDGSSPATLRRVCNGFAAPELYGRLGGRITPATDVYCLGAILYTLLARVTPLSDCGKDGERYPPVRTYFENAPPQLSAVARRAVSPSSHRRYKDSETYLNVVQHAYSKDRQRVKGKPNPIDLKIGHEIHIGLLKGIYSPVNQDDLFVGHNLATGEALLLVTDGVSISRYGTGDQASRCVREAASQQWRTHQSADTFIEDDPTLTLSKNGVEANLDGVRERRGRLAAILAEANQQIGIVVAPELPPGNIGEEGVPVDGVMAATTVAMAIEGDDAVFMFIGDSRIYLIRDHHIAQLSIDHNLKTQLVRNGHSPILAQTVNGANALVRCVGQFERGSGGDIVSVPLDPEFGRIRLLPGDRIVLCSDGITDYAGIDEAHSEELIEHLVRTAPDPRTAAFELMVAANRGGGGDNISCIVVEVSAAN